LNGLLNAMQGEYAMLVQLHELLSYLMSYGRNYLYGDRADRGSWYTDGFTD
jgi:hypothetical protein